jgi:NADPH:quinone reductase-like Zn-dependent oxidoreductase
MQVIELNGGFGIEHVRAATRPVPEPGPGEVLLKVTAVSLNYRDLLLVKGVYNPKQKLPLIPLSDGAGVIAAVGPGVARWKPGDRAVINFFQGWLDGPPSAEKFATSFGAHDRQGIYCEYRTLHQDGLLPIPAHLSEVEAAVLPCAGLTAWSAIVTEGRVQPGDTVLIQGTGGVSLFALQFAKLCGARVILTSSSDDKLKRGQALGADHGLNYRRDPEWGRKAREISGGGGVDLVVDVGGAGTLSQSLRAVRAGGTIAMIGVLGGPAEALQLPLVVMQQIRLQGVTVGSRAGFAAMLRAMTQARMHPVVDRVFEFAEARAAYEHMASGQHFGKIAVRF